MDAVDAARRIRGRAAIVTAAALVAGCASIGRHAELPAPRLVQDIRVSPTDGAVRAALPTVTRLVAATPLPVEALLLYSSAEANRLQLSQGRTFEANNASAFRCGPRGAEPLPWGCVVIGDHVLRHFDELALAGVVAHELGHLEQGHSAMKSENTTITAVGMIGKILSYVPGPVGWAGVAMSWSTLGAQGMLLSYSRDHEREADASAITRLTAAGFCAGPTMRKTFEALAAGRALGPDQPPSSASTETSGFAPIFSTHPSLEERWKNAGDSCSGPEALR